FPFTVDPFSRSKSACLDNRNVGIRQAHTDASKEDITMQLGRVVDSDGHVLEPPDLWKKNLEVKFRSRAPFLARDEEACESLIVDGRPSPISRGLGVASAYGQPTEVAFSKEFGYMDGPAGAYDPH